MSALRREVPHPTVYFRYTEVPDREVGWPAPALRQPLLPTCKLPSLPRPGHLPARFRRRARGRRGRFRRRLGRPLERRWGGLLAGGDFHLDLAVLPTASGGRRGRL